MSADGYGILGLAAIAIVATPVLIGGAVVAGSIYAAGKLVNHISEEHKRNDILRERREVAFIKFLFSALWCLSLVLV